MPFTLRKKTVGPWPMNTYLVICEETANSAIIDPGADANDILMLAKDTQVQAILITHTHEDHIQALEPVKSVTRAPVYINPAENISGDIDFDWPLHDGDLIPIGKEQIRAIHTPGHTPGMTSFDIGSQRIVVGDTIFVGGPGKTWSAQDFVTTLRTMQEIVFQWPDQTWFYPGHGPHGRIGQQRPAFTAFLTRGFAPDLHGDVTWE